MKSETICYVDESVHNSVGVFVSAFVFVNESLDDQVRSALSDSGFDPEREEFKSSSRMDSDSRLQLVRKKLMNIAGSNSKIAVFFGPFSRKRLGIQTLQALQSVIVRNGIDTESLIVHFDEDMFKSTNEAARLHGLFSSLTGCKIYAEENSLKCRGIQVADAVAHSFGQIVKSAITGDEKIVDIGGRNTGYAKGTEAPLSWALLMNLRYAMLTRPVIYDGENYDSATDPVVIDPENDEPVDFGQNPTLLGWGVQVAPEADEVLRQAVEKRLGKLWLGCIH